MSSSYGAKLAADARFAKGHLSFPVPVRLPDADEAHSGPSEHDGVLANVRSSVGTRSHRAVVGPDGRPG